jgi:hypothetical protein
MIKGYSGARKRREAEEGGRGGSRDVRGKGESFLHRLLHH